MDSVRDTIIQCRQDSIDWFPNTADDIVFLALALAGEVGECANMVKKAARGSVDENDNQFRYDLAMELTDAYIYLMNIAGALNVDLGETYDIKREFNRNRFGALVETEPGVHRSVPDETRDGGGGVRPTQLLEGGSSDLHS